MARLFGPTMRESLDREKAQRDREYGEVSSLRSFRVYCGSSLPDAPPLRLDKRVQGSLLQAYSTRVSASPSAELATALR
jgi:hypothetical protein